MKPNIDYSIFDSIELRIGTILAASAPDWSQKLLRFEVDFGEEIGTRIIFSGIKAWYSPDDFIGHQYPFLINLPDKKMGNEFSQGMMLLSDTDRPVSISPTSPVPAGAIIR